MQRVFARSAAGRTDRQVADEVGLGLYVVRSMLTNPLYVGRLRDRTPTQFAAPVDPALYSAVQDRRAARTSRRPGRPARRATCLLPMLECASCGQRPIGDSGRYRHRDPCPAFEAAASRPRRPVRGQHRRAPGRSHAQHAYERIVPLVLERVRLGAEDIAATVALVRYRRTRDAAELEAAMRRLDAEEHTARHAVERAPLTAAEVVAYLRDLPRLWAGGEPRGARALAEALSARVRAFGISRIEIEPTEAAVERGLAEAFGVDEVVMVGARGFEPPTSSSRTMRATKLRHAPTESPLRARR